MKKKKKAAAGGAKGGATATATAPTDLLVCFPARQHLALMPKPICSPSRTTLDKAVAARRRQLSAGGGGGQARGSPLFRGSSKAKQSVKEEEPQSPKVTCAGQIKVGRPKKERVVAARSGKDGGGESWITVVEEIERLRKLRKNVSWLEAVGIRRDALPFLGGVLRSLRLKTRCFGSLHGAADSSTEADDDYAGEQEGESTAAGSSAAASVFSKWLMVLEGTQEPDQDSGVDDDEEAEHRSTEAADECFKSPSVPPPNALLLMRCQSAPAKGLARRVTEETPAGEVEQDKGGATAAGDDDGAEDGDELVFMSTAPDFLKLSIDIAKETWMVGGIDPLARSRSWKR